MSLCERGDEVVDLCTSLSSGAPPLDIDLTTVTSHKSKHKHQLHSSLQCGGYSDGQGNGELLLQHLMTDLEDYNESDAQREDHYLWVRTSPSNNKHVPAIHNPNPPSPQAAYADSLSGSPLRTGSACTNSAESFEDGYVSEGDVNDEAVKVRAYVTCHRLSVKYVCCTIPP